MLTLTIDSVENVSAIIRTTAMSSAMDTCDSVTQEYTHGYRLWLAQPHTYMLTIIPHSLVLAYCPVRQQYLSADHTLVYLRLHTDKNILKS